MYQRRSAFMHDGNWAPQIKGGARSSTGAHLGLTPLFANSSRMGIDRTVSETMSIKNGSAMSSTSSIRSEPRSILVKEKRGPAKILSKKLKRFSAPAGPVKRVSFAECDDLSEEEVEDEGEDSAQASEKERKRGMRFSIAGMPNRKTISNPYPKTRFPTTSFAEEDEDEEENEAGPSTAVPHPAVRPPTRGSESNTAVRPPTGIPATAHPRLSSSSSVSTPSSTPGYSTPASAQSSTSSPASSHYSTPASSIRSPSPASQTAIPLSTTPPPPTTPHNPLTHYIPCMHPMCDTFYISTTLGPTFYTAQTPYNLHRKRGLCPQHATSDLATANAECKSEWETLRQNARRRTLGEVAADFKLFTRDFDKERERESNDLVKLQRVRVLGRPTPPSSSSKRAAQRHKDEDESAEWWRYIARPCTKKDCSSEWYVPFSKPLYPFYYGKRRTGLAPLVSLCPTCAGGNLEAAEVEMKSKREEFDDEEWVLWLERLRKDRGVEVRFWEKAQERVVKEKGLRFVKEEVEEFVVPPAVVLQGSGKNEVVMAAKVVVEEAGKKKKGGKKIEKKRRGESLKARCVVM